MTLYRLGIDHGELCLDAENVVPLLAEVRTGGGEYRGAEVNDHDRHGREKHHTQKIGKGIHVCRAQDIASLLDCRLLQLPKFVCVSWLATQQNLRQLDRGTSREDEQRSSRKITQDMEQNGGHDLVVLHKEVWHLFEPNDIQSRDTDHDPPLGHLR